MNESPLMNGDAGVAAGIGAGMMIFYLIIYVFIGFCLYKIFQKAGKENAWAAFIPIYNLVVLLEVVGKPIWWIVMFIIPCVNIYFLVMTYIELGKRFGKDTVWSVIFLVLLGIIGLPMLAFGDAQYSAAPAEQE